MPLQKSKPGQYYWSSHLKHGELAVSGVEVMNYCHQMQPSSYQLVNPAIRLSFFQLSLFVSIFLDFSACLLERVSAGVWGRLRVQAERVSVCCFGVRLRRAGCCVRLSSVPIKTAAFDSSRIQSQRYCSSLPVVLSLPSDSLFVCLFFFSTLCPCRKIGLS